jgi:hypothetical protein
MCRIGGIPIVTITIKRETDIMFEGLIAIIFMGIVIGLSRNIGTGISNTITKMGDSEDDKEKQR